MAVFDHMNKTTSSGVAPGVVDYYERTLLENAKPEMVHSRDAQKRPLPEHNGKVVKFRRMTPFQASTEPLQEGVTPDGQELLQTSLSATVKPYGRHVELTDEMDFYMLDNMHREVAQLLSDQAALSLDTICRDALCAGLNVQYAGGGTSRAGITQENRLTAEEIKKAVRTLNRNNAKPFPDGFYHAVIHPDAVFDLTDDPLWIDAAKYQDKGKLERYELGCLHKVKFYESTNAKIFTAGGALADGLEALALTGTDAAHMAVTIAETLTPDQARALAGKAVCVRCASVEADVPMCIERVDAEGKKVFFRWMPDSTVTSGWTEANSAMIVPEGGGASGIDVYATLIYGQNAYGDIELGGNGKNVRIIINPPGSAGAADPLEQRGTIAWKVQGFTSVILQDAFIVRVEHTCSRG